MTEQREHTSDEFGQAPSSSLRGFDPPMIGAAGMIAVDGIVERESGATPPPPTITVGMLAAVIGAMFVFGAVMLFFVLPLVSK